MRETYYIINLLYWDSNNKFNHNQIHRGGLISDNEIIQLVRDMYINMANYYILYIMNKRTHQVRVCICKLFDFVEEFHDHIDNIHPPLVGNKLIYWNKHVYHKDDYKIYCVPCDNNDMHVSNDIIIVGTNRNVDDNGMNIITNDKHIKLYHQNPKLLLKLLN